MSIELRSETNENAATVYCSGEVKAGEEGRQLRTKVSECLKQSRSVIVDLSNVRYMDSSGLGVLVSLYPIARTAGATLKYVNLVTPVDFSKPPSKVSISVLAS